MHITYNEYRHRVPYPSPRFHPGTDPAVPVPARRWAARGVDTASAALGSSSCGARASRVGVGRTGGRAGGRRGAGAGRTGHRTPGPRRARPRGPPGAGPGGSGAVAQPLSHNRRSFDTEHAVWARVVTQTGGNTHRTHPTQSTLSHRHCQPSDAHKAPTRRRHNMPTSHEPIVTSAHADPFGARCDAPSVLLSEVGARWRTPSPN